MDLTHPMKSCRLNLIRPLQERAISFELMHKSEIEKVILLKACRCVAIAIDFASAYALYFVVLHITNERYRAVLWSAAFFLISYSFEKLSKYYSDSKKSISLILIELIKIGSALFESIMLMNQFGHGDSLVQSYTLTDLIERSVHKDPALVIAVFFVIYVLDLLAVLLPSDKPQIISWSGCLNARRSCNIPFLVETQNLEECSVVIMCSVTPIFGLPTLDAYLHSGKNHQNTKSLNLGRINGSRKYILSLCREQYELELKNPGIIGGRYVRVKIKLTYKEK